MTILRHILTSTFVDKMAHSTLLTLEQLLENTLIILFFSKYSKLNYYISWRVLFKEIAE